MKKSSVITDAKQIDEILERGVENIYPDKQTLRKILLSGKRLRLYCGFDPTAASLHIGHGIQIKKLEAFRRLGHEVIFLFGGFTAMIGDPTDKAQARKALTRQEVKANMAGWKKQIAGIIDVKKITFKNNADWLSKINLADLLKISANFTAQQMLAREMFQKRIADGKDLYLTEFLYPLMQAYDSVAMNVDLEVGGNDQMFNMLAGRTLMRKMADKEKFVLTTRLLADPSGKKMGKTEGNMIALTDSAQEMFGKVMSWTDGMIIPAFEIVTDLSQAEIKSIAAKLADGALSPRDAKLQLAFEIVRTFLGDKAATVGRDHFKRVVQDREKPADIAEVRIKADGDLGVLELFVRAGLVKSNGEARRLITEKALKIDDKLVASVEMKVAVPATGLLLQRGKRQYARIKT